MRVEETTLPGVLVIEPDVHRDDRGYFLETFHAERYAGHGVPGPFVQDNVSYSGRGTLRGLHAQHRRPQGKLVQVLDGEVFDVAVDIRRGSPTFARWFGIALDGESLRQFWIPPGFAHGFCVTSDAARVAYKCTDIYDPGGEFTVRWDDPAIGIEWPIEAPVLSAKDAGAPDLDALDAVLPAYDG